MKQSIYILIIFLIPCCMSRGQNPNWKEYLGKSESQLIDDLGSPEQIDTINFTKSTRLLEYQSSLYDLIELDEEKEVQIKELFWTKEKHKIVFWLRKSEGKWIAIDFLRWNPREITY